MTGITITFAVKGRGILPVTGVFYNNLFSVCKQQSVPGASGRHHAVKHVDSVEDPVDEILGCSDAHQVARAVFREERGGRGKVFQHQPLGFPDAEPSDRVTVKTDCRQLLRAPPAEIGIDAALDDPEEGLRPILPALLAAVRPAGGSGERPFDLFPGGGIGGALVEAHHDVAAERLLDLHGRLRAEEMGRTVDMGLKSRPLFRDPPQGAEAEDLESAAVGQNGAGPVHEPVQPSQIGDQAVSRPQIEMVRVAEDDVRPEVADLLRRQPLHGALRADRHEGRRSHIAVRRSDCPHPGCAAGVFCDPRKFHLKLSYRISMQSP